MKTTGRYRLLTHVQPFLFFSLSPIFNSFTLFISGYSSAKYQKQAANQTEKKKIIFVFFSFSPLNALTLKYVILTKSKANCVSLQALFNLSTSLSIFFNSRTQLEY
jgi:hypothetical protein